jgi:two-component system cell cycle sensor histidine kinase/response regulator CckA
VYSRREAPAMNAAAQLLPIADSSTDPLLLRAAVEACRKSLAVVESGRIIFANQAFANLWGYPQRGDLVGRTWAEFVPDQRACTRLQPLNSELCGYPACEFEATRRDGTAVLLQVSCSPFHYGGRDLLVISAYDVTHSERRRLVRDSDRRFRAIFDAAAMGVLQCTTDGCVVESNPALERMLGYSHEELRGMHFREFTHPDDLATDLKLFGEMVAGKRDSYQMEIRCFRKDKTSGWMRLTVSLVRGPDDRPAFVIGMVEDITERKQAEDQLREAQKLEAIGRLAGGVAHDFNNLLTGVMLYCDLLIPNLEPSSRSSRYAREIRLASQQGAALVQQLMAVARQQAPEPQVLSFNDVLVEMRDLLSRLLGEGIELRLRVARSLRPVKMDPVQVRQVILNLSLNARDAMPGGGTLTLRTSNRRLPVSKDQAAGDWIEFSVADTGSGMDSETLSHLFELFYTTKGPGLGNGLGLATVHGIVNSAGGSITVESELGKGTQVIVRLPAAGETVEPSPGTTGKQRTLAGTETILLVEDNPTVRSAAKHVLEKYGYHVLEAANGAKALQTCRSLSTGLDLLLCDLVMPGMTGREVGKQLQERCPRLKVLYISGYDHVHAAQASDIVVFRKPFSEQALVRKVRSLLDDAHPPIRNKEGK